MTEISLFTVEKLLLSVYNDEESCFPKGYCFMLPFEKYGFGLPCFTLYGDHFP